MQRKQSPRVESCNWIARDKDKMQRKQSPRVKFVIG